jgi:glycosyltransferase involved in cell wall biosynthesis
MKICFVSHSSAKGGGERSLLETIHALQVRGVECVALLPKKGPLCADLERMSVEYGILPYRKWTGPEDGPPWRRAARLTWNLLWSLPAALRVRRWGPDLVYTNTSTVPVGAWAAALTGRPHVWHIRELGRVHNRRVFDLGERAALSTIGRLSALVLANSEYVAAHYRPAIGETRIAVVRQAVTPDRRDSAGVPPRTGRFRCVVVGSLSRFKRQEEAVEALARLVAGGRAAELLIVGSGDPEYERRLREMSVRLGLEQSVHFLGEVPAAWPFIESADVVVQCSRYEAFGRVAVEGMLAARPVVGASSAGTTELIHDGQNGRLYEVGDVDRLAVILRELMDSPEERTRLGNNARAWAEARFGEEQYGDALVAHFHRILESARFG